MANDPVFLEIAQGLAKRVEKEVASSDADACLRRVFALCLSREPSDSELAILRGYAAQGNDLAAMARVLFNADNFITRE